LIAHPGEARHGDAYRTGVQRYEAGIDHQAGSIDAHPLVGHAIQECRGPAVALLRAKRTLQSLRGKRVDVDRVVVETAEREAPFFAIKEPGRIVADHRTPGEQANPRPHAQRLVTTEHV